jgi:glycosyltransferase involved in cell wall biosynthesis
VIPDTSATPRATIVIPLLDQVDAWLEQCVRSALAQTVRAEVVVVHSPRTGASNRELLARLGRDHASLRVLEEPPQSGFAAALNLGFRSARAERVGILLSDDWLEPRAAELALPHDADIVSTGHTEYLADGTTALPEISRPRSLAAFERLPTLEEKARYLKHFFLFRRATLLAAGGADETIGDFPGIDDFDLVWTLLERGATVAIVETPVYNYRDHDGERLTLRDRDQAIATLHRILDKHGLRGEEKVRVLAAHVGWLGRTVRDAYAERTRSERERV